MTIHIEPLVDATHLVHKLFAKKFDDSGAPYVEHCLRVSRRLGPSASDDSKLIAILHDVIEDTYITREHLREWFGETISYSVSVLSKQKSETYSDFIDRILSSVHAGIMLVKLADLYDNTSPYRLSLLRKERRDYYHAKYTPAIEKITAKLGSRADSVISGDIWLPAALEG